VRTSRPLAFRGVVAAFGLIAGIPACERGDSGHMEPPATIFGSTGAPLPRVAWTQLLSIARGTLRGAALPTDLEGAGAPARRVFLLVEQDGHQVVTTGLGATLVSSVSNAARNAVSSLDPVRPFRLELDVALYAETCGLQMDDPDSARFGLDAIVLATDATHVGAVLPTEIAADKQLRAGKARAFDIAHTLDRLRKRARLDSPGPTDENAIFRVRVEAHRETSDGQSSVAMVRGWPERHRRPEAPDLLRAVKAGADYLARGQREDGRFDYRYHPLEGRSDDDYELLRHAGAVYALLEAYDELDDPAHLASAERGIAYLLESLTRLRGVDGSMAYLSDRPGTEESRPEQQKVGGAGLALVALAMHAETTGTSLHLDDMRSLARFIVHQQYPDGHFRDNDDVRRETRGEQDKQAKAVIYYAGEANLGLLRLYAIDPNPAWLSAAKKGVEYCIEVRDAGKTVNDIDHDHWLSYAIDDLSRFAPSRDYADHAFMIAEGIASAQRASLEGPSDMADSYHGAACATAVRVEAYAADIELARRLGRPDGWLVERASEAASFVLAQQYDAQSDLLAVDPARVQGGVRESPFEANVRIDYVQHSISGWLHLARALRDPRWTGRSASAPLLTIDTNSRLATAERRRLP
jgi:hypothetical protein